MPLLSSNIRPTKPSGSAARATAFETLEQRQLLSSASISYPDFSSTAGLTANGFGSTAPASGGGALVMTDSQNNEARSVFYNTPVPVDHFTTHFTYRADNGANADGFTFALQENGPTALGNVGGSLGYQGMGGNGVAVGVSIFNEQYRVYSGNSDVYVSNFMTSPFINVGNGDTYEFTITYDGTTLTTSIVDENNSSNDYSHSFAIDLDSALNAHSAYVGFTAGTGGLVSTQRILNWDYSGSAGPTITTAAAASPGAVTATSTALSVAATHTTDVGALTYNWTVLHKPSGAATPTFTSNNSTSANDTSAHFYKDGTYIFRATATDTNDLFDVSDVAVVVHQTATAVRVTPHAQSIAHNGKQLFIATVTDQFGHPLRTQRAITWSLLQGSGSIDASTGLFIAGSQSGHVVIEATDKLDTLTGTSGATVV